MPVDKIPASLSTTLHIESMPNIATVLKEEIRRLARKEAKTQVATLRKTTTQHRRDIAALKRQLKEQERRNARLEKALAIGMASGADAPSADTAPRFSPTWLAKHRAKLGISAAGYAKLVGVSALTIYNWEKGKNRPRNAQLEALATVRSMGKKQAMARLQQRGGKRRKRAKKA